jgi:hypothetical protein
LCWVVASLDEAHTVLCWILAMSDVFFSYQSKDRKRVRPIHDSLVALGFDVFWDQEVPPVKDWDEWIRHELKQTRVVVVFWSKSSVRSKNVRHEAAIGAEQGKLVPVLLDQLSAEEFPMGFHTSQALSLMSPGGKGSEREWARFQAAVEEKALPPFAQRLLKAKDAELKAALRRAELAEAHEKALESAYGNAFSAEQEAKVSAKRALSELEGLISQLHSRLRAGDAGDAAVEQEGPQTESAKKSNEEARQGAQKDPLWFLSGRARDEARRSGNDATGGSATTRRQGKESLEEILASIRKALAKDAGS